MSEWFESWFDSPYYHILYNNRDEREAEAFIGRLVSHLNIPQNSRVLDLACGKGRHAIYMNKLGYDVTGADLSGNSIEFAKRFENTSLRFIVHDMRNSLPTQYDAIFNLFTSFGYFGDLSENLKVLKAVHQALAKNGVLVIDFLNAVKVENQLVRSEVKNVEGINFAITRTVINGQVLKEIDFMDAGRSYHFEEKVQLIKLPEFEKLLAEAGFELRKVFGDYNLGNFAPLQSDRLILVAAKK